MDMPLEQGSLQPEGARICLRRPIEELCISNAVDGLRLTDNRDEG